MREIVNNLVWVGNAHDIRPLKPDANIDIEVIVDLALDELPAQLDRDSVYLRIPLRDGADNPRGTLSLAIRTVVNLIESKTRSLICCSAGMSRSPAVTAAAIAIASDLPLESALTNYFRKTSHDISPGLWRTINEVVEKGEV